MDAMGWDGIGCTGMGMEWHVMNLDDNSCVPFSRMPGITVAQCRLRRYDQDDKRMLQPFSADVDDICITEVPLAFKNFQHLALEVVRRTRDAHGSSDVC